ncbi:MAG: glycosyltransferase family 2 protein [Smithellaceae bacterium]|nr:glycosyltransferase family 2 protein [Smithellaceae bacterium]
MVNPTPDLSIIIVSYNTADLTMACLASVLSAENCGQVIVVDNASTDGSAGMIQEAFPGVQVLANTSNRGFAAANNQALPLCRGRYIFFLNPDTKVRPDTFTSAIAFMDLKPSIGLAGPSIINPDGTRQESVSRRYPGEKFTRGLLQELPGKIACILGAAMIARTDIIRGLGGFDEAFFLYGEDQDLALRLRKAGFSIGFIPESVVVHIGGGSEKTTPPTTFWEKKVRAEYLFYEKHYGPEIAARICRADLRQARFRILILQLWASLGISGKGDQAKLDKYQAYLNILAGDLSLGG